MNNTFELAKKYYPRLWSIERLNTLLAAGKLTQEEYDDVVNADQNGED